jgi:hypothetical protein
MAKSDYLPANDSAFLLWHDRFLAAATAHAPAAGLAPADITAITTDNEDLHAAIANVAAAAAAAKNATAAKNAIVKAVAGRTRGYALRIKAKPGYDEALGDTFGIVGAEDTTDLSTAKPTLTGKAKGGGNVELGFNKSTSEGVNIYCRRDGDAAPVFLARDTASPYVDNRPLLVAGKPEVREYRAIYVVGDAEIGSLSDEAVITVAP